MNQKSLILIFILLLPVLFSCEKDKTQPVVTNNPLKSEQDLIVHSIVKSYAEKKSTAGLSIGIIKDDQIWQYGYGEIIKGLKTIPNGNTVFEIGSITKTFTALMLMDLLYKVKVELDEPVNNLLPSNIPLLMKNGRKVTIKHLLNHTSGLPRLPEGFEKDSDPSNPYVNYDSTSVYEALKNVKLKSQPGEKFEYSNFGMAVAGLIIERTSGRSYADYLAGNICKPLDLHRTKAGNNFDENLAKGYTDKGRETPYWKLTGYAGAGTIYSSTDDLLRYARAIMNPEKSTISSLLKDLKEVTFSDSEVKVTKAWFLIDVNGKECLVHDGGTGGFRSFIYLVPSNNLALVILGNNGTDAAATVARNLAEKLIY
ncbi:serine hydrolase domain-containing protein [Desertivirga brevis]|uniref:serine hydrolase domain-containing protein n=1 Tax=Desertivirga brevis TaxID=2810310 RepID=UPI001A9704D2|nr:serine hydrolase domain-containing protein [Pedobacter sp. SYSU D00873]